MMHDWKRTVIKGDRRSLIFSTMRHAIHGHSLDRSGNQLKLIAHGQCTPFICKKVCLLIEMYCVAFTAQNLRSLQQGYAGPVSRDEVLNHLFYNRVRAHNSKPVSAIIYNECIGQ